MAGLPWLDGAGTDRYRVAAVADEDGVLGQEIVNLPGQPERMDRFEYSINTGSKSKRVVAKYCGQI